MTFFPQTATFTTEQLQEVPYEKGVSYELCAGIVDQQKSTIEIAQSEILEETGFQVPLSGIEKLFTHQTTGESGWNETVFYAEVTDDMKVSEGGGNADEGEFIDIFYLPLIEAKQFVFDDAYTKTGTEVSAFCWYFWKNNI